MTGRFSYYSDTNFMSLYACIGHLYAPFLYLYACIGHLYAPARYAPFLMINYSYKL